MPTETLSKSSSASSEWGNDGGDWGTETVAASTQYGTWESPPTGSYNNYATTGFSEDDWGTPQVETAAHPQSPETGIGERLREFKDKIIHGMGRKALDAVMNHLPSFGGNKDTLQTAATNVYENPGQIPAAYQAATEAWSDRGSYAQQAVGHAKEAGREVAGAGITAAKETVMKYYGLEKDQDTDKLRVARKLKFGKAVVKTVINPIGTTSSVGTRAGYAARKASVQSAKGHLSSSAEAARNWRPQPITASGFENSGW